MHRGYTPHGNNLLSVLRDEDIALIDPWLSEWTLPRGHVLCEAGDPVRFCYLPRHAAVAAFVIPTESGSAVESAIVGREGALGGIVSHGRIPAFARATVLQGGSFYRIAATDLEKAKQASPTIHGLFVRYADCLLAQVFQSVACNASHTIVQRAARWLEAAIERSGGDEVMLTQEQFAGLLGVGRSYASRVLQQLKAEGIVAIRRGTLRVADRDALAARACGCNQAVRDHFDEVLRGVYPQG
ncbi:MAG: Crp/Fnr family transcriptional regulator [Sphingomonadales bacterium]|nr:Crp/Fnr family transcriptional regulator [Sphingomonadales bacterium]